MKKLYEIWFINSKRSYPMINIVSVTNYYREDFRSMNLEHLKKICERLNIIACEDESYEIREIKPCSEFLGA